MIRGNGKTSAAIKCHFVYSITYRQPCFVPVANGFEKNDYRRLGTERGDADSLRHSGFYALYTPGLLSDRKCTAGNRAFCQFGSLRFKGPDNSEMAGINLPFYPFSVAWKEDAPLV